MFLQASQILGLDVIIVGEQRAAGQVRRLVFDLRNGRLVAIGVRPRGWLADQRYCLQSNILQVEPHAIVVSQQTLERPDSLPSVKKALAKKTAILGQKAQTESGQSLGRVIDVLLDDSWQITKYYLHHLMSERILLASDVHSITKRAVIFLDRVNEPREAATVPEAATP